MSGNSATSIFHTSHVFAGGSRGASEKSFCFSESDAKGLTSLKYIFESTSGATSRLRLEVWVKDNFAVRLLFRCFFRKKVERLEAPTGGRLDRQSRASRVLGDTQTLRLGSLGTSRPTGIEGRSEVSTNSTVTFVIKDRQVDTAPLYLMACGLIGEPTARVIGSGGAANMNS